jgi:uncharacterized membrane protein YgcG
MFMSAGTRARVSSGQHGLRLTENYNARMLALRYVYVLALVIWLGGMIGPLLFGIVATSTSYSFAWVLGGATLLAAAFTLARTRVCSLHDAVGLITNGPTAVRSRSACGPTWSWSTTTVAGPRSAGTGGHPPTSPTRCRHEDPSRAAGGQSGGGGPSGWAGALAELALFLGMLYATRKGFALT